MKDKRGFAVFALLVLVIWQFCISLSKILMNSRFFPQEEEILFFKIVPVQNNGAAFGILRDSSLVLGILGVFVIIFVFWFALKHFKFEDKTKILVSSIFTAGILGNTTERLTGGFVLDYIKLTVFDFPVFNLFDVLICISVVFCILFYLREEYLKKVKNGGFGSKKL